MSQAPPRSQRFPVETPSKPAESWSHLPRLTLGGALCGGFAGSFAGALLGAALGAAHADLSLGLDGALIGAGVVAAAGAVYGLVLALRDRQGPVPTEADDPEL